MKKFYNVSLVSRLLYVGVLFLSNYLAYFAACWMVGFFQPIADDLPYALLIVVALTIYILVGFALPLLAIFFFFKYTVEKQHMPSEDKYCWVKSCAKFILPAEITRFLVCQLTLGQINTTGSFAFLPSLLFESTYLRWADRSEQVRQNFLQYNFADFTVYALCFFIYVAIHLALVMMIYRRFWLKAQKDRDDLIVHR